MIHQVLIQSVTGRLYYMLSIVVKHSFLSLSIRRVDGWYILLWMFLGWFISISLNNWIRFLFHRVFKNNIIGTPSSKANKIWTFDYLLLSKNIIHIDKQITFLTSCQVNKNNINNQLYKFSRENTLAKSFYQDGLVADVYRQKLM